jgi:hypothetical protein
LFEPSHRLFVLRCKSCGAPFFSNGFSAFDPSAPRPAALPSAAALVFSLLFTILPAMFAAMQYQP